MPADLQILVRHIRRMAGRGRFATDSDRSLLQSYARQGDQDAFATLVTRHAMLVAGVCRRVLGNAQDIEDVFQATFLVLARKATVVNWRDSVANWLHGVAHRLALRTRADAIRRQNLQEAARARASSADPPRQTPELQSILDAELENLPEVERLPLILCYLEGRTRDEAARQCGWSLRTLERRLEQGRRQLRDRLVRRGVDLSVVLLAVALSDQARSAYDLLTANTLKFLQAEKTAGVAAGSSALRLAETALPVARASYLKLAPGLMLVLTVAGVGATAWLRGIADEPAAVRPSDGESAGVDANQVPSENAGLNQAPDPLPGGAVRLGSERFRGTGFGNIGYSADGKRLITAGRGGIQVLDATSGAKLLHLVSGLRFNGQQFSEWSSAISADGKLAALADSTGARRGALYDISTGRLVCELQTPANRTTRLATFSRDGALLAAMVSQVCVDLYDTKNGKLVRSVQWEEKYMPPSHSTIYWGEVGFLADGKSMVVSIHHTGVIRVFDMATGTETRRLVVSPNGMAGMALSPDGKTIVALPCVPHEKRVTGFREDSDESIQILEAATGKQVGELLVPDVNKRWLKIGPDNRTLFAGGGANLGMWNLVTERKVGEVPLPTPRSLSMTFALSPDGQTLACPEESVITQIDLRTGKPLVAFTGHISAISAIAVSSTGSKIATGGYDGKVILWDRSTGEQLRQFALQDGTATSLFIGPDAKVVYSLGPIGIQARAFTTIRAFDVPSGKEIWKIPETARRNDGGLLDQAFAFALSKGQLAVLTPGAVSFLDASSGKETQKIGRVAVRGNSTDWNNGRLVGGLSYTNEGDLLLAWNDFPAIWRSKLVMGNMVSQGNEKTTWAKEGSETSSSPTAGAFSPDGKFLVLGGSKPYLLIMSAETGKEIRRIPRTAKEGLVNQIAFAPDSTTLAWTESNDGLVHMADIASGRIIRTLPFLGGGATALAFASEGQTLAVGYADSTAIVWDPSKLPGN